MRSIFEKSQDGQKAYSLPKDDPAFLAFTPACVRKDPLLLPEMSELDLTRHFIALSRRNIGIDNLFTPLGSCTMKFNPRICETAASLPSFVRAHPLAPKDSVLGCRTIMQKLLKRLCEITGMDSGTLQPNAGSQGEFAGVKMIARYHKMRAEPYRNEMLIPDNAHGTNPATAAMCGFSIISLRTNKHGDIDLNELKAKVGEKTAGLMLTNPNTLGLFSSQIDQICNIIHNAGGLLYYDGANLNAILNIVKPGEMGFDVMHLNLHKTFATPHGGGGPGSGPVLCKEFLAPYLPEGTESIGRIATFHGNFAIYLRAYLYILLHGDFGLKKIAQNAVLNANYLKKKLEALVTTPFLQHCMHEFVISADVRLKEGVRALDIAKRLLDYGFHPPSIYFPLIIKECMLIEPTESESKKTLDEFAEAFAAIVQESTDLLKSAPHTTCVSRLDEAKAARALKLSALDI